MKSSVTALIIVALLVPAAAWAQGAKTGLGLGLGNKPTDNLSNLSCVATATAGQYTCTDTGIGPIPKKTYSVPCTGDGVVVMQLNKDGSMFAWACNGTSQRKDLPSGLTTVDKAGAISFQKHSSESNCFEYEIGGELRVICWN